MNLAAKLRRAGSMTLLVYACHTIGAALFAWPLGVELSAKLGGAPAAGPQQVALVLEVAAQRAPQLLGWAIECAVGYALLAPLLALAWLHAMLRTASLFACLKRALFCYRPALALYVCALLAYAATLGLAALLLQYAPRLLPSSKLAEDALRVAVVCAATATVLGIATAHDLARAALVAGAGAPARALFSGLRALSFPLLALHGTLVVAAALCMLLAEATGRVVPSTAALCVALLPQQLLVFVATALRAVWLALALRAISLR